MEIIRVILKLYEQWKNFDERKEMATILSKMPKPKPPPNRYFVEFNYCFYLIIYFIGIIIFLIEYAVFRKCLLKLHDMCFFVT